MNLNQLITYFFFIVSFTHNKRESIMSLTAEQMLINNSSIGGNLVDQNSYRKENKQRIIRLFLQELCQKASEIEPEKFYQWRKKNIKPEKNFQKVGKLLENLNSKLVKCKLNNLQRKMYFKQQSEKIGLLMEIFLKFEHEKDHQKQRIVEEYEQIKKLSKKEKEQRQEFINKVFSPDYQGKFNIRQCIGCIKGVIDSKYGKTYYSTQSQSPCLVFEKQQLNFNKQEKRQLKNMLCYLLNIGGGYCLLGAKKALNWIGPIGINKISKRCEENFIKQINKFCPNTQVTFIPMMHYLSQTVKQKYQQKQNQQQKQILKCVPIKGKCVIRIKVSPQKNTCYELVKSQSHEKIIGYALLNEQRIKNEYEKTQLQYLYSRQKIEWKYSGINHSELSMYDYMHIKYEERKRNNIGLQKCQGHFYHQQAYICDLDMATNTENKQRKEYRYKSIWQANNKKKQSLETYIIDNQLERMKITNLRAEWNYLLMKQDQKIWFIDHNQPEHEIQKVLSQIQNAQDSKDKKYKKPITITMVATKLKSIKLGYVQCMQYKQQLQNNCKKYGFQVLSYQIKPNNNSPQYQLPQTDYFIYLKFNTFEAVAFVYLFFISKQVVVELVCL